MAAASVIWFQIKKRDNKFPILLLLLLDKMASSLKQFLIESVDRSGYIRCEKLIRVFLTVSYHCSSTVHVTIPVCNVLVGGGGGHLLFLRETVFRVNYFL